MDAEVMEWGERPTDHTMMAPLAVALDSRLSARARGVMFYLLARPVGLSRSAEALTNELPEGRDAIRAALNELEAAGYIQREPQQIGGRWTTRTKLLPYGTKPQVTPTTGFQPSVDQPSVDQPSVGPTAENPPLSMVNKETSLLRREAAASTTYKVGAAAENETVDAAAAAVQDEHTEAVAVTGSHIPWTEVHLLRSWFNVETQDQVEAWQEAWRKGVATVGKAGFDAQVHLSGYLIRCKSERRSPNPSRWLRFLVEDAEAHSTAAAAHAELLEQRNSADGGEQWALRSLTRTPRWE